LSNLARAWRVRGTRPVGTAMGADEAGTAGSRDGVREKVGHLERKGKRMRDEGMSDIILSGGKLRSPERE